MKLTNLEPFVVWVCSDCMLIAHGHGDEVKASGYVPERPPLQYLATAEQVTEGLPLTAHREGCMVEAFFSFAVPFVCECDLVLFSKAPCQGCGSTTEGERHALTAWYPEDTDG